MVARGRRRVRPKLHQYVGSPRFVKPGEVPATAKMWDGHVVGGPLPEGVLRTHWLIPTHLLTGSLNYSLYHSSTHWLTQLLTYSLTHLLAYSPTPWLTQFLTSSLNYSLDYPRTGLITHPVACFLAFACYLIINFYMTGNERVR